MGIGGLMLGAEVWGLVRARLERRRLDLFKQGKLDVKSDSLGIICRLADHPVLVYELQPSISKHWRGVSVTTNAAGMRTSNAQLRSKPSRAFRIAGVGDSVLFGQGVAFEDTCLEVLRRQLDARSSGASRCETLDFSVPGYNAEAQIARVRERVVRYHPDVVVVGYCENDIGGALPFHPTDYRFAHRGSALVSLVKARIVRSLRAYGETDVVEPRDWARYERLLRGLRDLARAHRFEVVTLITPYRQIRRHQTQRTPLDEAVIALNRSMGFWVADSVPCVHEFLRVTGLEASLPYLAVYKGDVHPNAIGHAIMARCLADIIAPLADHWAARASAEADE